MEGDPCTHLFFVQTGLIKIYRIDDKGREQILSFIPKGDLFPHTGLFFKETYPANAEVLEDAVLLSFPLLSYQKLMAEIPQLSVNVTKILGNKILMLQRRVTELTHKDAVQRTISAFIHLAIDHGKRNDNQVTLQLNVTNQEIADMIGISRETVSRTLNQLKKMGKIDIRNGQYIIYDIEDLKEIN